MLSYNIGKMNNSIAEVMSKSTLITAKYGQNRISISITQREIEARKETVESSDRAGGRAVGVQSQQFV